MPHHVTTMKKLKVIAALDSFKGALSSADAGNAVKKGFLRRIPSADVTVFSVGDGGEGTADAIISALSAERKYIKVHDTNGDFAEAQYGVYFDGGVKTAVFDMAAASGIKFAAKHNFDIMNASTEGVGEMIRYLASDGCKRITICLGGSGTNDGGSGALSSLGAKFFSKSGEITERICAASLSEIVSCDLSDVKKLLRGTELTLLYDVAVPLTGENGASMMFSRQKGADEKTVALLEKSMKSFSEVCDSVIGSDLSKMPGSGAAGGLGYGMLLAGGTLKAGAQFVIDAIGFRVAVSNADLVITGEGKTDIQTAEGKLPKIIAKNSEGHPVICLCGANNAPDKLYSSGITSVFAIADRPLSLDESISRTAELLEKTAFNIAGIFI